MNPRMATRLLKSKFSEEGDHTKGSIPGFLTKIVDQTLQRINVKKISFRGLIIIIVKKKPGMEPEV